MSDGWTARERTRDLGELLAWLDGHINLEARSIGAPPGPGGALRTATPTRIRALLDASADPQTSYPIVHITGTNGKTSTSRMVTSLLTAAQLSVGTYTSPHLESVNERISGPPLGADRREHQRELSGSIPDADLADQLRSLAGIEAILSIEGTPFRASWFELVTAAAFRWFADIAVDVAVIEAGLGGRFDTTNVADGLVAVITNVELDHTEYLGPTREHIARDKVGIVKPGAICVVGEEDPAIAALLEACALDQGAEAVWLVDRDFACESNDPMVGGRLLTIRTPAARYEEVSLLLHGAHQGANAAVAVAATEAFLGIAASEDVVMEGLGLVTSPGRLEIVASDPLVVLDGAHNAHGAAALGAALDEGFGRASGRVVVFGCLGGHDPTDLLRALGPESIRLLVACAAPSPRAVPANQVADASEALGIDTLVAPSVADAIEMALADSRSDELVLVTGSLHVVGAARSVMANRSGLT